MSIQQNKASKAELDLIDSLASEAEISRQLSRHAELLPIATFKRAFAFMLQRIVRYKWHASSTLFLLLIDLILLALIPYLIGIAVDTVAGEVSRNEAITTLWQIAIFLVLLGVVQAFTAAAVRAQVANLGQKILADMREEVIDRALDLPSQTMEKAGIGDALSRVADDVDIATKAVNNVVPWLVRVSAMVVVMLFSMVLISPYLLLIVIAMVPFYVLAMRWYLPRTNRIYKVERIAKGARAQSVLAAINGSQTVHAYGIEKKETTHVAKLSATAYNLETRIIKLVVKVVWFIQIPESLALLGVVAIGYWGIGTGGLSVGMVTAACIYLMGLFWPMMSLIFSLDDVQSAAASLTRMVGVIDSINPAQSRGNKKPQNGTIRLAGVHHSYLKDGRVVLKPIDLTVAEGETLALVGASGAGKSTLASIMAGTLEPTGGKVFHGDADLAEADLEALRATASIVSQDVHVFHGTLRDDLTLAKPSASDEELWQALERVGAKEWAAELSDALDTMVGEKGHQLSAEQGQQLALARIVLQDPAILIMDEATADEGSSGARTLELAALEAAKGRTTVIVAHRLSQAKAADRILVMDEGAVIESGSHQELLDLGGKYAKLWQAWSS